MEWLRLYSEILNDSKIMLLPEAYRWRYIALLCIASESKERGTIPSDEEVLFKLRISEDEWGVTLQSFIERGLVEKENGACRIHAWGKRQYESDDSAPRVQKHRYNKSNVTAQDRYNTVTVTTPDTDTDTDTDTDQKQTQTPPSSKPEKPLALHDQAYIPMFAQIAALFGEADLSPSHNRIDVLKKAVKNVSIGGFDRILEAANNLARSPAPDGMKRYDWLLHRFDYAEHITEYLTAKNNARPRPRKYAEVPDDWRPDASATTTA
jgi:hypothetical protein